MKRCQKIWLCLSLLLSVAVGMRPQPLSGIAPHADSILLLRVDAAALSTQSMVFPKGSAGFSQIRQALRGHTYHTALAALYGDTGLNGNQAGYWLHIYWYTGDRCDMLICGGTGKIELNGCLYEMGYFGNAAALAMMEQLSSILGA